MHTGLDRILAHPGLVPELTKGKVGLLAHPASVTKDFVHALTALRGIGVEPKRLFGPEHGWAGHAQDMISVAGATAGGSGIISLYGETYEDLKPKPEHLDGLDVMLVDLQDVGARYYTFVWTAVLVARECHEAGVKMVVLDRPNPIGRTIEGRMQESDYLSFVGLERIPVRHGLTLGEIVHWRSKVEGWSADIVLARDGNDYTGRWVMPSPNMPTLDTALVYPGGCLLEGTNLSDGRGTTRPFEITGAPWVDGERLAKELKATGLPGFVARPLTFEPTFHKHAKKSCGGVQIHVTSAADFRPVATYVALIALAHHQAPNDFRFRTEKYEYVDDKPAFDILTGSAVARERIMRGDDPLEIAEWVSEVDREARNLVREARG